MDKRLSISLQGGRKVSGVLRGFDIFLNLVVDDAVEESGPTPSAAPTKLPLGQVVSPRSRFCCLDSHVPFGVELGHSR